ncbi:uncharacterized protein MYCFIDRAFT_183028 [Pseudocercospora fijiensis CIRAD86]|uniref:Uncharacterized protein n=1 Tax=Pseudocercospora fijiensis (strain CIRAD86) TaxID=383855 RepID=M3AC40_PSEFD|nr:uncharacterized protein MYCFIDRAFT_183028 [Pseudocercospora fijiensis CIRAD86]EME82131.1 hypothetical protein MYCFIDRAFT_183028 [Pseudocercospora fijiensis CIRAD86]
MEQANMQHARTSALYHTIERIMYSTARSPFGAILPAEKLEPTFALDAVPVFLQQHS